MNIIVPVFVMACSALAVDPIVWWKLDKVVDSRTIRLKNEKEEVVTITLACVGKTTNEMAAIEYIGKRLANKKLDFWALETSETNSMSRPMCLFIDEIPTGHNGAAELVYHFPMLNEELIAKRYVEYQDVTVPYDKYGLRARLQRASTLRN